MAESSGKPKIKTLVFMDLESTGLPFDVGTKNVHITEMSLIAVDRNSFEEDNSFRVLNKISLCIRPRTAISLGSMNITGLYNDILENQEEFDDSIPKMLEYFFRRLQRPICLLAHNGNRFDFPVLQAELKRLNYCLGSDIVCADTLAAIRDICQSSKKRLKVEKVVEAKTNIDEEDIDCLLSKDIECFSNINLDIVCADEHETKELPSVLAEVVVPESRLDFGKGASATKPNQSQGIAYPGQGEKTPVMNKIPADFNPNIKVRKRKTNDPSYHPRNDYKKRVILARRNLFPDNSSNNPASTEIHKLTRFSLPHLYNYFFNEDPPNSHYAEIDCISLSKVCQKIHEDFLHWIDENSVAFSTIEAMW